MRESNVELLSKLAVFRALTPKMLERVASHATRRSVTRGTTLFRKGDPGNSLILVVSGQVKISVLSPDGREAVLNVIHPGEVLGEIALLDGRPRTADAVALTDCELMTVDRRDFQPFLRDNPDVTLKLIEVLCERLRHTSEQVEDVIFLDLPGRLAKTLLYLMSRSGQKPPASLSITQREIGQMIGMSRESANKQLRAWTERGWLQIERGRIVVLDGDALTAIADQDFEPK
jgi:CRP/FNR family transcriptional regulator, cyclic AMP receptor protein